MSSAHRSKGAASGGLGVLLGAVIFMMAVAGIGFVWTSIETIGTRREASQQTAERHCENASTDGCQALKAEIRSAVAEEASVDLAAKQLWLNIIGLIGLGATVIYAHAAWGQARRSADVAHEALEDTRRDAAEQARRFTDQLSVATKTANAAVRQVAVVEETAHKQLRAYLYATKLEIIWVPDEGYPLFSVSLHNAGKTPAINVTAGASLCFGDVVAHPPLSPNLLFSAEPPVGGGITQTTAILVEGSRAIRVADFDGRYLYISGKIRYEDVFGFTYETDFGFYTTMPVPPDNALTIWGSAQRPFVEVGRPQS